MIYNVRFSAEAEEDLRDIFDYITYELRSPLNAKRQIQRLRDAVYSLKEMPNRYPIFGAKNDGLREMRFLPVDNYTIFYIPYNDNKTVLIARILYSSRNFDEIL